MGTDITAWGEVLQGGPHDAQGLAQLRPAVVSEVERLLAVEDRAAAETLLTDYERWAASAPPAVGAAAYVECGRIAETLLADPQRAQELHTLAIDLDPTNVDALEQLQVLLVAEGQLDRLEAVLNLQARALEAHPDADPEAVAYVHSLLGFMHAEHRGDLCASIDAYERAMDACPNIDTMSELAGVYMQRGADGDDAQAAELYCALGEVLAGEERVVALQTALDNRPDHIEALELLEETLAARGDTAALVERWRAYLKAVPAGADTVPRRRDLAQALVTAGRHEEALEVLQPLCADGNDIALHMRENILQGRLDSGRPIAPQVPATRSGHTVVGFRLPAREQRPRSERRRALVGMGSRLRASLGESRPARAVAGAEGAVVPGAPSPPAAATTSPAVIPAAVAPPRGESPELGSLKPIALPPVEPAASPDLRSPLDSVPPPGRWKRARERAMAQPLWRWTAAAALLLVAAVGAVTRGLEGADAGAAATTDASGESSNGDLQGDPPRTTPETADGRPPIRARVNVVRRLTRSSGGKLTHSDLLRSIRRGVPKVRRCYRRALRRDPELAGRLVFELTVARSGRITRAERAGGSLRNRALTRCAMQAMRDTRFEKPAGKPATVTFPLRFSTGQ